VARPPAPGLVSVMRVGIYSRWIDTLGGGEQTLAAIAATLGQHHDVDIISHEAPDWAGFKDRLGFDLTGLRSRVVAYDPDHYRPVQEASKDYQLFVNCSYLDAVRAYADLNVMQVFFPPEAPEFAGDITPVPARSDDEGARLRAIAGLYPLEWADSEVFAWSDGHARFELMAPGDGAALVTLTVASNRPRGVPPAVVSVSVDGISLCPATRLPRAGFVDLEVRVPRELMRGRAQFLDVHSDSFDPSRNPAETRTALGVRIAAASAQIVAPGVAHRSRGRGGRRPAAGIDRWTHHFRYFDAISTYDLILANSHFTQRWIARRFGRASELLYPPVQVGQFQPVPKKQQVISVGRFFVEGHSKKQLDMIHMFRRLCDAGLSGWEYHLVGGTHHDPTSTRYLEDCQNAAAGYPIRLHPNAPLHELVGLYAESSLYWNATGYGEDPDVYPDRFEHFGMTTVEAMASGCIPLSYARAGQPEVIEHDWSGILWETFADLGDATLALIRDPSRRATMAAAAVERSKRFTYEQFSETFQRLLAEASFPRR
jgi:glycosyltransferase involved in cell wall biosynthesis